MPPAASSAPSTSVNRRLLPPDADNIARTDRLVIRRLRRDDFGDFHAITSNPDVMRYIDDGQPHSAEMAGKWFDVFLDSYVTRGWGCYGVTLQDSDRLIGFCGFVEPVDHPGVIDLMYAFLPDHWGNGFATEAARAVVDFGFRQCGMNRIDAAVTAGHDASIRVLEKVGMAFEKRETDEDGDLVEYYAITR